MKKIYLLLFTLLLATTLFAQGINFETLKFENALKKAKEENKILFIDAYTVWCGPCKWMANNTFKDTKVGELFNEKFVSLKVDMERGEGLDLRTRFDVTSYPTYIFLDGDGVVVYRSSGMMKVDAFLGVAQKAIEYASSDDNIGRLAARYTSEKNNENLVRFYLDKLLEVNSKGYYQVLEQYLTIQTKMKPESPEMALFLANHNSALTFGGIADKIIKENFLTTGWRQAVRKDIRDIYKNLPQILAEQTLNYAVEIRDSNLIDKAIIRLSEEGLATKTGQRERLMIYYYLHTGDGVNFKRLQLPHIEDFYSSKSVEELREGYQKVLKMRQENPTLNMVSNSESFCGEFKQYISQYSKFVETNDDSARIIRWAEKVYKVLPEDNSNLNFYANALYLYGNKQLAMQLKKKAIEGARGSSREESVKNEYEDMKSGKIITL